MIHILDRQTERILDVLVNQSDRKIYWDTKMTEGLEDNVLIFEFRMLADSPAAKHIIPKNKLTAQDQDGFHRLFVIDTVEMSHDANGKILFVSALGDHIELASDEPIPPQTLAGQTAETAVQFVLANTRYQSGQIDFAGSRTISFDAYTNPLAALQKIASVFDLELRFRVTVNPDGSITRIVDLLKPDSVFDGKEIVFGKDMTGIRRKENTENICTRLVGIGPADEDGNFVTFASVNGGKIYVEDEEAFQRWNNAGRHIWGIFEYQPEDGTEVTPQQLLDATKKEMEKRKNSAVEWEVQAAALEQVIGLEHERVRVGMNVRIKDEAFDPPIYLEARVLETEMPELDDPNGDFSYTFGNYREVKVIVPAEVKAIQKILFHNSGGWSAAKVKADIAQQIANEAKADVEAANARIDNLIAVDITALHAEIQNLEAIKANVEDLNAINGQIENLTASKANVDDLNAVNARIDSLVANDLTAINAEIENLQVGKADITDLNAVNATIATLQADVGSINTLLAGNLGAENFRAGAIYAGSGVIAQGAIGDAEISNLNASKINAGILNTALVTIQGANGRMKIANNRLQVFANKTDGSLYERVSLGDVNGDGSVYGLRIRGADGQTVLLDENGVKREGITDGSITNEKIADDANISGSKLDIASVVTKINEGTTTIQSSKVFLDGSTLDVQFSSMKNTVNAQGQTITNHETRITATEQGLATKVSVSQYQQDQAALSSQLSQMSTQIQQHANQIALKADASNVYTKSQIDGQFTTVNTQISNLSAQLAVQADQIATKVSKTEFESLQIGGRNLLRNSHFNGLIYWVGNQTATLTIENGYLKVIFGQSQSTPGLKYIPQITLDKGFYTASAKVNVENLSRPLTFYVLPNYRGTQVLKGGETGWRIITWTFEVTADQDTGTFYLLSQGTSSTDYMLVEWIKLEKGNRATDWTPAPEDTQSQIDGLGSRMTTAETSITQLSNQIALKANQSTVDNLTGQVSSLQAQLTVQAGQIATKVSRTEFESLQIGGRNLAGNTDYRKQPETFNSQVQIINGNPNSVLVTRSSNQGWGVVSDRITTFVSGQVYTLSFELKTSDVTKLTYIYIMDNDEGNVSLPISINITADGQWHKYIVTFTSPATRSNAGIMIAADYRATSGNQFELRKLKLELGNRATDWTPAPEDVQGQIDGLGSRMTTAETSITQLSNQIALKANQSTVDNLTGQVSSLQAQLTVQAGQIATKVEKNGVISAINQTAESIKIQASKVDLAGYVTFTNLSTPGQTTIDGGNLKTGSITADKLNVTSLSAISGNLGTVTAGTIRGVNIYGSTIEGTVLKSSDRPSWDDPNYTTKASIQSGWLQFWDKSKDAELMLTVRGLGITLMGASSEIATVPSKYRPSPTTSTTIHNGLINVLDLKGETKLFIKTDRFGIGDATSADFEVSRGSSSSFDVTVKIGNHTLTSEFLGDYLILRGGKLRADVVGTLYAPGSNTYIANDGEARVVWGFGYNDGDFSYRPIRASFAYVNAVDINTGTHVYIRPKSGGEVRATRTGTTDTYVPVRASSFPTASLAENKLDIHVWEESALEKIRQATIYEYYLKSELEQGIYRKRQGLVVGEGYNTPAGVIDGDGVEQYLMNAWSWKAIQELDVDLSATIDRIAWLETENSYLKQRVNYLENKLNELEAQIS